MPDTGVIASSRVLRRRIVLALVVAVAMAFPAVVSADEPFQVRYKVDRPPNGPVRVSGTVSNEGRQDTLDVYVTAEALDAAGKVIGRGVSFVSDSLPQRAVAPFVISIPAAQTAANFRVRVSSFRYGYGIQTS